MTLPNDPPLRKIQFYATTAYPCGYLEGISAQSLIAAPHHLIDADIYSGLIQLGFRRSGKFAYRPHCINCQACIPVRLLTQNYKPNRSQRRALRQHDDLVPSVKPLHFSDEHYALYKAYQIARHSGRDDEETEDQYRNFLVQSNVNSKMIEFRQNGQLKIVSVIDVVDDGISAMYTFYDASDVKASYGTFNIVWMAEWCRDIGLPYLYLGYWIEASPKMAYKKNFAPLEALIDNEWQLLVP